MSKTNQLLLFTCCLIILIGMVCLIDEKPYVSKKEILESMAKI